MAENITLFWPKRLYFLAETSMFLHFAEVGMSDDRSKVLSKSRLRDVLPLMRICLFRVAFSLACRHKYLTLWPRIFVGLMCSVGLNMNQTTI